MKMKMEEWNEYEVLEFIHELGLSNYLELGLLNGRQLARLTRNECRKAAERRSHGKGVVIGDSFFEEIQRARNGDHGKPWNGNTEPPVVVLSGSQTGFQPDKGGGDYHLLVNEGGDVHLPNGKFPPLCTKPDRATMLIVGVVCLIMFFCLVVFVNDLARISNASVREFRIEFLKYSSIPIVMVPFTYAHIWLALWMTFYPVEFVGCWRIPGTNLGFPFGWQGIVPFKGAVTAKLAVKMLTEKLLSVDEVFETLDSEEMSQILRPHISVKMKQVLATVAGEEAPKLWGVIPDAVKNQIYERAGRESPAVIQGMLADMRGRIEEYFDLEKLVVSVLLNDLALCNDIFISCADKELAFIRNAGAWMGGVFGFIQMLIWFFYQPWWLLPTLGFLVGALTNYIALLIIFRPIEKIKICGGRYTLQGLFLQRQDAVSAAYAHMVSTHVLNAENINRALMLGPHRDRVEESARKHIEGAFERSIAPLRRVPLSLAVNSNQSVQDSLQRVRAKICDRLCDELYDIMRHAEPYMEKSFDLESTMRTRMAALPPADFEDLLHPLLKQDEPKLVLMGGVLGVLIGLLQVQMF